MVDRTVDPDWVEPTDAELDAAATAIIEGCPPSRLSADCLACFFATSPDTLENTKLSFLFSYWQKHTDPQTGRQNRAEFDMLTLLPAVGNIMILDVLRDGFDARYRLYGTGVAAHAGRDWTGERVSDMNRVTRNNLALMYRAIYLAAYRARRPIYSLHRSPDWVSAKCWRRVVLPMTYEGEVCSQFIVGNIPVDPFNLSREDQARQQARVRKKTTE
ncbi:hypothetical protein T8K17_01725 [Thalassobaculum sp. OXR-137]|uniref:hypothetical protein n=1 Tax=Thalassobaculum sp. OXR-137 TaxID=3100173 RepID=UPI002AC8A15D|nr:hypothetical protein [Thalassobaculum sp. OXR-137]WPZ34869.1 hypothetical protein T8K17_01725 [Thalassobaculum sp. OXR-137]